MSPSRSTARPSTLAVHAHRLLARPDVRRAVRADDLDRRRRTARRASSAPGKRTPSPTSTAPGRRRRLLAQRACGPTRRTRPAAARPIDALPAQSISVLAVGADVAPLLARPPVAPQGQARGRSRAAVEPIGPVPRTGSDASCRPACHASRDGRHRGSLRPPRAEPARARGARHDRQHGLPRRPVVPGLHQGVPAGRAAHARRLRRLGHPAHRARHAGLAQAGRHLRPLHPAGRRRPGAGLPEGLHAGGDLQRPRRPAHLRRDPAAGRRLRRAADHRAGPRARRDPPGPDAAGAVVGALPADAVRAPAQAAGGRPGRLARRERRARRRRARATGRSSLGARRPAPTRRRSSPCARARTRCASPTTAGPRARYVRFSRAAAASRASAGIVVAQGSILAGQAQGGLLVAGAITLAATISQFTGRVQDLVTDTLYPAIVARARTTRASSSRAS